jgi:hypothetical protein
MEFKMAYITKTEVATKSVALKELNKKFGVKARFSGSNSSELTLRITQGSIDFGHDYCDVNHYWIDKNFSGAAKDYLNAALSIMKEGYHDNSDVMTDYFDVSWYNRIVIGSYDKNYVLTK